MTNVILLAHRGVTENGLKDNTIESLIAIKKINSLFKLGIEFDVQLTKDNKLILFHDQKLNDMLIEGTDFKLLKEQDSTIIMLEDLFVHFTETNYLLNIELKIYNMSLKRRNIYANIVTDLLKKFNINYFVSSYDNEIIDILNKKDVISYYISEKEEEDNVSLTQYNLIDKFDSLVGIYTLYDSNYDEDSFKNIVNKGLRYLITDNVKKLEESLLKEYNK